MADEDKTKPVTTYNVHLYREMCLRFDGIEASTPEEAAAKAADLPTDQAIAIDDCDGKNLGAHVDVVGDAEYVHSRQIDFDAKWQKRVDRAARRKRGIA